MGERKVLNKYYPPLDPLHPPLPAAAQFREVIRPSGEEEKEGRMGERKVLNKYYPPDFEPAKIPRRRKDKNKKIKVRMMHPMRIRCNTCGNCIDKGTKFNSLKESVIRETYRGILISRFYFKCTNCSAELTMKTDPQNSDYVVEAGATRNFEPWCNEEEAIENLKRKRDAEEIGDAMNTLENKALDSKQEMNILATLEEIKSINTRHEKVTHDMLFRALKLSDNKKEVQEVEIDEVDNAITNSIVFHTSKDHVKRIHDDEDEDLNQPADLDKPKNCTFKGKGTVGNPTDSLSKTSIFNSSETGGGATLLSKLKFIVKLRSTANAVKKPRLEPAEDNKAKDEQIKNEQPKVVEKTNGLQSICQSYDSDESE